MAELSSQACGGMLILVILFLSLKTFKLSRVIQEWGKKTVIHGFLANPAQTGTNIKSKVPAGHFPGIRELFSHSLVECSSSK